jgi:hypothetical protein
MSKLFSEQPDKTTVISLVAVCPTEADPGKILSWRYRYRFALVLMLVSICAHYSTMCNVLGIRMAEEQDVGG